MIRVTKEQIDAAAPNAAAIKNAHEIVQKGQIVQLYCSDEETLVFGECKGSGSSNYRPSADFVHPDSPVYRCTCPSRQFPCKHVLALLYAYLQSPDCPVAPIPQDIFDKREKVAQREQKKTDASATQAPKKVNKGALAKKLQAQLEGLSSLEDILLQITKAGLATQDGQALRLLEERSKQLANHYLTGAQIQLRKLILSLRQESIEQVYRDAYGQLTVLYSLVKRGKDHLSKRLADPDLALNTDSAIEEWLGHAWQIGELREYGLVQQNAELVQLAFHSYEDAARQEYVDLGLWMNLATGEIHETYTYRPYRAIQHIREDDSVFSVAHVSELFLYPGDINRRIRWEQASLRDIREPDYALIRSKAHHLYADVIKAVKNQIKNPLAHKHPAFLLSFQRMAAAGDDYVLIDGQDHRLLLKSEDSRFPDTLHLIRLLPIELLRNQVLLVTFTHNQATNQLTAHPLTFCTEKQLVRLAY